MYCELYIDLFFMQNFFMDSMILLTLNRIVKGSAPFWRNFAGGALGAALTCVITVAPVPFYIKLIFLHTAVNTAMIFAGLKIRNRHMFVRALALLYAVSVFYGGIFSLFYPCIRRAGLFFTAAVCGYYAIRLMWDIADRVIRIQRHSCAVSLYTKKGERKVKALIDTGNMLKDAVTGKPVSVIAPDAAKDLFDEKELSKGFRLVPCHTFGEEGMLPVFCIEKMYIHQKSGISVEKPLIGVSSGKAGAKREYEMILNPDLTGGAQDVY